MSTQTTHQGRTSTRLCVALRLRTDGPVVWRELVTDADLAEARSEFWFNHDLRRGQPKVALSQVECETVPVWDHDDREQVVGYALTRAGRPLDADHCTVFSPSSLKPVALRAATQLLARGVLKKDDLYYYDLEQYTGAPEGTSVKNSPARRLVPRAVPLNYIELPLEDLKSRSLVVGEPRPWEYPVFYTQHALAHARRCARRGAGQDPPVETGAVLAGPLCSCPVTGEFYGIICLALEMVDAQEGRASLELSAGSWSRIQAAMTRVQSNPQTAAFRILGQAHGHPFAPASCPECQAARNRTSVFVSEDDLSWSRAVFTRQPWQLCHIFGQDEQGKPVDGLFGQRDCTLMRRSFYLLPEADGFDLLARAKFSMEVESHG